MIAEPGSIVIRTAGCSYVAGVYRRQWVASGKPRYLQDRSRSISPPRSPPPLPSTPPPRPPCVQRLAVGHHPWGTLSCYRPPPPARHPRVHASSTLRPAARPSDDDTEPTKSTVEWLQWTLHKKGVSTHALFNRMNKDGGHEISRAEFVHGLEVSGIFMEKGELGDLFRAIDADESGFLSKQELEASLRKQPLDSERPLLEVWWERKMKAWVLGRERTTSTTTSTTPTATARTTTPTTASGSSPTPAPRTRTPSSPAPP